MTLKLAETSVVKSWPSVPYGANLFILMCSNKYIFGLKLCMIFLFCIWKQFVTQTLILVWVKENFGKPQITCMHTWWQLSMSQLIGYWSV